MDENGFPTADNLSLAGGGIIDYGLLWRDLIAYVKSKGYRPHIALQSNGLKASTSPAGMAALSTSGVVGQQTFGDFAQSGGGAMCLAVAAQMHCSYVEVYAVDCVQANDTIFEQFEDDTPTLTPY